jgi:hypothetical protein
MDDIVLADSTLPNFSLPPLEKVDLTIPGLSLPDPTRPDPFLPDLTTPDVPDDLDRLDVTLPDPRSPDLLSPVISQVLVQPDEERSALQDLYGPVEVHAQVIEEPATLDPSALPLAANSADALQIPPHLRYEQVHTTQDEMARRTRHLAPLLLGLDGQVHL